MTLQKIRICYPEYEDPKGSDTGGAQGVRAPPSVGHVQKKSKIIVHYVFNFTLSFITLLTEH